MHMYTHRAVDAATVMNECRQTHTQMSSVTWLEAHGPHAHQVDQRCLLLQSPTS